MAGRSREKAALVFLCLLIVLLGCAVVGYLIAGHSFNVTATQIDEAVGTMDGYTVIVFEGTLDSGERQKALAQASALDSENESVTSVEQEDIEADADQTETDLIEAQDEERQVGDKDSGTTDVVTDVSEATDTSEATLENTDGSGGTATEDTDTQNGAVVVAEVCDEYRSKGANVFALDIENTVKYRDGLILKQGDQRIGVFSITGVTTVADVTSMLDFFDLNAVDLVVAIAPQASFLATTEGIDIVITTNNAAGSTMGGIIDGVYVVQAPLYGAVGAVLISPGSVVSSKVISEL